MKESVADLLRAVAVVLSQEVLPGLPMRSWEASRVRSALMILQHCEDRVLMEKSVLSAAHGLLSGFLSGICDPQRLPQFGPQVRELLAEVAAASQAAARCEPEELETSIEAGKALLCRLIRAAGRDRLQGTDDSDFRARLHELLREMDGIETRLFSKASALLPM
ncbi:MAG TPA: hypothetical protein VJQ47_13270 [Steroidobacteraceae bacterium]|nr:hypothetical protein [Steroidobacteraceae bacterium]